VQFDSFVPTDEDRPYNVTWPSTFWGLGYQRLDRLMTGRIAEQLLFKRLGMPGVRGWNHTLRQCLNLVPNAANIASYWLRSLPDAV
jgi:hypothetical protein